MLEMHDVIFNNQQALRSKTARSCPQPRPGAHGLDNCLEQGKYAAEIDKDFADGSAAGVVEPRFLLAKPRPEWHD